MTRPWRWTLALLLCGVGAGLLGPVPPAAAVPVADAGVGTVVADLGVVTTDAEPGFSFDGAYYGYLVRAGDSCDLHLYDVAERRPVDLAHPHVVCDGSLVHWAAHADTLQWQVPASGGDLTAYGWDPGVEQVSVLASDAHVLATSGVSADGRYLAFTGRSDSHPAPSVDDPGYAGYVYDRTTGVSLPLSKPHVHVQLRGWSPVGAHFIASAGGHRSGDLTSDACFGSGASCRVVTGQHVESNVEWSRDGTAVMPSPGSTAGTTVYDFTDGTLALVKNEVGFVDFADFVGPDARRLLLQFTSGQATVWDRATDELTTVFAHSTAYPSPPGGYLLFRGSVPETWRYLDLSNPHETAATYRGTDGYWTGTGAAFLGLGPASEVNSQGCSSLRQWSPVTNTVSLFGPPGSRLCYRQPDGRSGALSSASGRFALFDKAADGSGVVPQQGRGEYVVDLRRHVLLGPLRGVVEGFAPAGHDVLAVRQPLGTAGARLLLVDPRPSPDVDDKPRWSSATPPTGARVEAAVGKQVQVQMGASDLQGTPVNLYFRWRDAAGTPIASAPKGWSCERKRLSGGATVADCTFAPPKDFTATRFLDVSVTNATTGAQSDTRSYRVRVGS